MGAKVLVVDDSRMARELHAFMLRSAGFDVREAENGSDAFEKLLCDSFDVVITDINMPQMDGYELIRRLRATKAYTDTPVIIVSTESEATDKSRGFEAGANVYVVKPTRPADLIANVHMLLGTTGAQAVSSKTPSTGDRAPRSSGVA